MSMISSRIVLLSGLCCCVFLPACKIVKTDKGAEAQVAADASGDEIRITRLVEQTFEQKLLPHIDGSATDMNTVHKAIQDDLQTAAEKYAYRASGDGAAWNFAVKGSGIVVESNRQSRAARLMLDIDNDGTADMTVQLGPVFKGTALRDIAPFYNFTEFRDQLEFARLGRALNDRISTELALPDGDLLGQRIDFVGVFSARSPSDKLVLTPVHLEVGS